MVTIKILTSLAVKDASVRNGTQLKAIHVKKIALAGEQVRFIKTLRPLNRFDMGLPPLSPYVRPHRALEA